MSKMMQAEWVKEARAVGSKEPVCEEGLAKRRLVMKPLTASGMACCGSSGATAHTHRQRVGCKRGGGANMGKVMGKKMFYAGRQRDGTMGV